MRAFQIGVGEGGGEVRGGLARTLEKKCNKFSTVLLMCIILYIHYYIYIILYIHYFIYTLFYIYIILIIHFIYVCIVKLYCFKN